MVGFGVLIGFVQFLADTGATSDAERRALKVHPGKSPVTA
jgi:hypothetical protein